MMSFCSGIAISAHIEAKYANVHKTAKIYLKLSFFSAGRAEHFDAKNCKIWLNLGEIMLLLCYFSSFRSEK